MSRNRIIALSLVIAIIAGLMVLAKNRNVRKVAPTTQEIQADVGIPIQTAPVHFGHIDDAIPVTGDIKALDSVTLSSKISGKVATVYVREGDVVRKGQTVATLDRSDAEAQLRQAQAGLQSALARLSQAQTSANVVSVHSAATIQQAKAGLEAAEATYEKVLKGARSQERMISESQVVTAKAGLDNAQANLKRYKQLFQEGAIAAAQLEVSQTQYDVALAQYNAAKQGLSLVEEGARSEDVRAAATQVTQAKEALKTAKANAAQNELSKEDIKNAKAGVAQAEAQVALAQEQLNNTSIVSSINGIISKRMTEPGQMASPGAPLMEAVDLNSVFFQANVSETLLARVKPSQVVTVIVDAYSDRVFSGKVEKIYPTTTGGARSFDIRVNVPNQNNELKPGMFARGSIITSVNGGAMLIPVDAIEERNGESIVFVLKGNTVKKRIVTKGMTNTDFVEVLPPTHLNPGDAVVISGHENLEDGSKVYVPGATEKALR